mmetsp:Transcript_80632/g.142625  ORF Transcript_80632/g.142625 Transcript_80632/m.142625 type:complete len:347 (+) Transcript_80632:86-1126(+)
MSSKPSFAVALTPRSDDASLQAGTCVAADAADQTGPGRDKCATMAALRTVHRPASAGSKRPSTLSGIQRPTSAKAASCSRLKMWAKTPREKSQQDKRQALEQFNIELDESLFDLKLDGLARRQAAEAAQRSQRHSLSGQAWKVGGACAGTVRPASLSRVRGGTTSGLFSDVKLLEGSEFNAAVQERCSKRHDAKASKQRAESRQRSRGQHRSGEPWRAGGACAGTVRAASLSRTRGSTISGLFSDVQPLAGSESAALLQERMKLKQKRRDSFRSSNFSMDSGGSASRSASVPSLVLPQHLGCAKASEQEDDLMSDEGASCATPKSFPAGSALASVRCARQSAAGGA